MKINTLLKRKIKIRKNLFYNIKSNDRKLIKKILLSISFFFNENLYKILFFYIIIL